MSSSLKISSSDNTPFGVLSEDDIFKDEDLDEGKDLFSVLFGDD